MVGGLVTVIPLRVLQLLTIIEPGTGFYSEKNFTVILMYCLIALCLLIPVLLSFISKKEFAFADMPHNSVFEVVTALLLAVTLIIDSVNGFQSFLTLYKNFISTEDMPTLSIYLNKSGAMASCFGAVFGVLSAMYFSIMAVFDLKKSNEISSIKFLALSPIIWCMCRIIRCFMRTISYLKVSELFFELVMLVVLMLFLFVFAQKMSKLGEKGNEWKLTAYGIPSIILCTLCFLPGALMTVIGKSEMIASDSNLRYCDMAMALFIFSVLWGRTGIKASNK